MAKLDHEHFQQLVCSALSFFMIQAFSSCEEPHRYDPRTQVQLALVSSCEHLPSPAKEIDKFQLWHVGAFSPTNLANNKQTWTTLRRKRTPENETKRNTYKGLWRNGWTMHVLNPSVKHADAEMYMHGCTGISWNNVFVKSSEDLGVGKHEEKHIAKSWKLMNCKSFRHLSTNEMWYFTKPGSTSPSPYMPYHCRAWTVV